MLISSSIAHGVIFSRPRFCVRAGVRIGVSQRHRPSRQRSPNRNKPFCETVRLRDCETRRPRRSLSPACRDITAWYGCSSCSGRLRLLLSHSPTPSAMTHRRSATSNGALPPNTWPLPFGEYLDEPNHNENSSALGIIVSWKRQLTAVPVFPLASSSRRRVISHASIRTPLRIAL